MVKTVLKRLALPRTWNVPRKSLNRVSNKFISKPNPGKTLEYCVSINTFIKEILFLAEKRHEVKQMLKSKEVLVNGTRVKDEKFPVGLFDVVDFKDLKKKYILTLSEKGKLTAIETEDSTLVKKVVGKTIIKGNKIQLNLFDGLNLTVDKSDARVGDVIVIKEGKIVATLKLEKGAEVILISGKHCGKVCVVEDFKDNAMIVKEGKDLFETSKKYAYVIGDGKTKVKVR